MNRLRKSFLLKGISCYLTINLLLSTIVPNMVYALADPGQVDFTGFEPVSTNNMVNMFNGDFNYNLPVLSIPGPDGAGYAMGLSYHSGVQPEEDASWVGYGWTLNPGILTRNKVGFADDFNGVKVESFNKNRPNWTIGAVANLDLEYHSTDKKLDDPSRKASPGASAIGLNKHAKKNLAKAKEEEKKAQEKKDAEKDNSDSSEDTKTRGENISVSLSKSARLNNYRGFHSSYGFGAGYGGYGSVNADVSRQGVKFNLTIDFLAIINGSKKDQDQTNKEKKHSSLQKVYKSIQNINSKVSSKKDRLLNASVTSFSAPSVPFDVESYVGLIYKRSLSFSGNILKNLGGEIGYSGSFNYQLPLFYKEQEAYGYLHNQSYESILDNTVDLDDTFAEYGKRLGDYSLERESSVGSLDRYIGIPYATQDQFITTGELAVGGFKARTKHVGHFFPAPVKSFQKVRSAGMEVGVSILGEHASIGIDLDFGQQTTILEPWRPRKDFDDDGEVPYIFEEEDDTYFRFNGDPSGELRYSSGMKVENAPLSGNFFGAGFKNSHPRVDELSFEKGSTQAKRQTLVDHHTFEDTESFDKNTSEIITRIKSTYNEGHDKLNDIIREFQVQTASNQTITYGIPVMSSNETSLSLGMQKNDANRNTISNVDNNYIIYNDNVFMDDDILKNKYVSGRRINHVYSSAYLMTSLTNINYVDLTQNGPSEDDFGGWTKFDYRKWKRENSINENDVYNYRTPYKGYLYSQNSISLKNDDAGTVSRGQKEIYYMKGVETKTHYACFITNKTTYKDFENLTFFTNASIEDLSFLNGSGEIRQDGVGAPDLQGGENNTIDPAGSRDYDPSEGNTQSLEYLEKIILISKERPLKPLQTTHFEYDYSLCKGIPNSLNKEGKLTLKKVYTEHEGTVRSKISPYVFDYKYPTTFGNNDNYLALRGNLKSKYEEIINDINVVDVNGVSITKEENPSYAPEELDAWGNYRHEGNELADNRFEWTPQNPASDFDPAAWNLKQIHLPSGGQIIVQYEQNDYAFVQNKKANVMVSLLEDNSNDVYGKNEDEDDDTSINQYKIDISKLGLFSEGDNSEKRERIVQDYVKILQDYFYSTSEPNNYIYFKFLYGLTKSASLFSDSEYISGHTTVRNVYASGQNIYIQLGDKPSWDDTGLEKQDVWILPKDICYDTYITSKSDLNDEKIKPIIDDIDETIWANMPISTEGAKKNYEIVVSASHERQTIKEKLRGGFVTLTGKLFRSVKPRADVCQTLDYGHSYFRIPVYKRKLGGGVRVKRLLMYDPGLDTDDQGLYGTEYSYIDQEGNTSGVATMEPASGREENPFVSLLNRGNQSLFRQAFFGKERKQLEGPIGETVYPSASVGYSRIVVENIHKGATGTGYQEHEFYTSRDYPFIALDPTKLNKKNKVQDWLSLPLGLINIDVRKLWFSQGYAMITNQMNGVQKRTATYQGDFKNGSQGALVSKTEYEYFDFRAGDKLKTLKNTTTTNTITNNVTNNTKTNKNIILKVDDSVIPGYEEDVAMYAKEITDKTFNLSLELDFLIDWQIPTAIAVYLDSWGISLTYQLNKTGTHVTNKVINLPSILKKTTSYTQGVTTINENLIFDQYTGKPLVTKTYDLYDQMILSTGDRNNGAYYSYSLPAYIAYPKMGNKSVDNTNTHQISDMVGSFVTYGESVSNDNDIIAKMLSEDGLNITTASNIQKVMTASASVFDNNWFENTPSTDVMDEYITRSNITLSDKNRVLTSLNSIYRPVTSYTFGGEQKNQASQKDGLIFKDGPAKSFSFFDWNTDLKENTRYKNRINENWLRGEQITKMSPHGYPVETENLLDIPSAVRFGYKGSILPVISAKNASYESIFFKDFEYETNTTISDNIDHTIAHSGTSSLRVSDHFNKDIILESDGLKVTDQLKKEGLLVNMWIHAETANKQFVDIASESFSVSVNNAITQPTNFSRVARSGEWDLYEARIDLSNVVNGSKLFLKLDANIGNDIVVYVDDIKVKPTNSEVSCNVYDLASLRLLTQFDDQHFGMYYVYDNEARLQRMMIETERGMKVLKEQITNQRRVSRNEQ